MRETIYPHSYQEIIAKSVDEKRTIYNNEINASVEEQVYVAEHQTRNKIA